MFVIIWLRRMFTTIAGAYRSRTQQKDLSERPSRENCASAEPQPADALTRSRSGLLPRYGEQNSTNVVRALPQNVFIHQILTKSYKTARQHFCTSFIWKCEQNSDFVKELRYSDETHFHVNDKINSKKFGYWLHGKPDVVAEAPLCSVKITRIMITEQ